MKSNRYIAVFKAHSVTFRANKQSFGDTMLRDKKWFHVVDDNSGKTVTLNLDNVLYFIKLEVE